MSGRIEQRFAGLASEGRTGLIPFITAGDPDPAATVDIMHGLVAGGADLLELGVPFSDPMADGPVIQQASERAIERGVTLTTVLSYVREFREGDQDTPVILMGYLNPVERMGAEPFATAAADAGVDGVLLVDCPPEERGELGEALRNLGIAAISMTAPTTTPHRIDAIAGDSAGFVYYVSFKGVTGASRLDATALAGPVASIRERVGLPVAVGFGIKDAESALSVSGVADAVVIGSALVERLADAEDPVEAARGFLAPIRESMDNDRPVSRDAEPEGQHA